MSTSPTLSQKLTAEAIGFNSATRGCTLLPPTRMASIASGMP